MNENNEPKPQEIGGGLTPEQPVVRPCDKEEKELKPETKVMKPEVKGS